MAAALLGGWNTTLAYRNIANVPRVLTFRIDD
jgi:hypothetical protein